METEGNLIRGHEQEPEQESAEGAMETPVAFTMKEVKIDGWQKLARDKENQGAVAEIVSEIKEQLNSINALLKSEAEGVSKEEHLYNVLHLEITLQGLQMLAEELAPKEVRISYEAIEQHPRVAALLEEFQAIDWGSDKMRKFEEETREKIESLADIQMSVLVQAVRRSMEMIAKKGWLKNNPWFLAPVRVALVGIAGCIALHTALPMPDAKWEQMWNDLSVRNSASS